VTEVITNHFVVHFDPEDDATIASSWAGAFTTAQQMASAVATELEDAHYDYDEFYELRPPVPSRFAWDGKIHVYIGDYYESEWGWFTKDIHVARTPFVPQPTGAANRAALVRELRHELFHAEENAWWTVDTMHVNRWWTEAWAEYASTYMYSGLPGTDYPLDPTFCKKPLTTVDGNHEYQTAHFIEKLRSLMTSPPGSFASRWYSTNRLWTLTAGHGGSFNALDGVIKAESGASLSDVYKEWIINEIWSDHGGNANWIVDNRLLDGSVETMDLDAHHRELSFTVPAGGTCSVRGVRVTPSVDRARMIAVSVSAPFPDGVNFFIEEVGVPLGDPRDGQYLHLSSVDSYSGERTIYVVLTNADDAPHHATVSVDEPIITANPGAPTVDSGIEFPIQIRAENLPYGLDEITFTTGAPSPYSGYKFGLDRKDPLLVRVAGNSAETVLYITDGSSNVDHSVAIYAKENGVALAGKQIDYHVR